ncbi:MAG: hypothetical protein FWD09_03395 [Lentimicrobiaceae bacterium]|nr:hypothetical protein [Lentimicrobiaceae bacterium]
MKKVLATPEVQAYVQRLVRILYENGYFSFEDTARKYVKDLPCAGFAFGRSVSAQADALELYQLRVKNCQD